jgi:hypothetical protein
MRCHCRIRPRPTAGPSPANVMVWRWAAASQIGTSHVRMGTRKQDACRCFVLGKDAAIFCALVCDGAGSASYGGEGASLITRTISLALREHFELTANLPTDDEVWSWIDQARDLLARAANARRATPRDFASTMVLMVVSGQDTLTVHVGDGSIVVRATTGEWRALSWPESGEYASTTYFVTDDPAPRLRIERHRTDFDGAAVFSDGIENLALDLGARVPHEPFFRSMIAPVDRELRPGRMRDLSDALGGFLDGPRVCDRTDDDKSLIVASSR